jgi:chromosome segregation ATPase
MVALAAISTATPSVQSSLMRSRLEAAKREADQAKTEVDQLRNEVSRAEATQQQRQDRVRQLASESDPTYASRLQTRPTAITGVTQNLPGLSTSTGLIVNTSA